MEKKEHKITIINYTLADREVLLQLLLELHSGYFHDNASQQIQELRQERNVKRAYSKYVDMLGQNINGSWLVLLAKDETNKAVGFIIGSIAIEGDLVLGNIGKFEDWYVETSSRGDGIGAKLYNELEKWFIEKGCQQIISDTWEGNKLSIEAHKKAGFFISGIQFSKKTINRAN